ncbi:MAG TPA: DegT/DnrJ/EryC1/StrS family aminotransferase [Phycisphaerae bacterium]|nr:DegT/DnrJ/EryC1/StrS family aminotransferase [Phycisphaerae bacterium]HRY70121.1 DegT/DnrJ/EryC1/StrS family aminotransferase [Phycisphaerae bacterium]HSA28261.1 DegT/DnrJ/EryC1/StrS family aminotransferase [Phycisphaerae bacterium]
MTMVTVTKPSLPPLDEYVELLADIWDRQWLTNRGHYHEELEKSLAVYLGVPYVSLFCNGMIALQVGLQALKITGEVITTPFSFVATTHALYWNHCTPVFCDIDPVTCNLDPTKVESLITPRTTAIMPVHVYGTPCDVEALQRIADTYGLRLFYDAAHAFGVHLNGQSVLNFGDLSMLSFHATKVFNTAEGGALITGDAKLKQRIDYLKNFGFADEVTVVAPGTNGKMNELQAALGIVQLRHVDVEIAKRREIDALYREELADVPGIRLLPETTSANRNYAYFPIFVNEACYPLSRDSLYAALKGSGFLGRRYFYPLISEFPAYRGLPSSMSLPVAATVSRQVLCLPVYASLDCAAARTICEVIKRPIAKETLQQSICGGSSLP